MREHNIKYSTLLDYHKTFFLTYAKHLNKLNITRVNPVFRKVA